MKYDIIKLILYTIGYTRLLIEVYNINIRKCTVHSSTIKLMMGGVGRGGVVILFL